MDKDEEFLNCFFSYIATLCFDKAKDHIDKEKTICKTTPITPWISLINILPQIALVEKNYIELCFVHYKNKGFLRKDNSLKSMYDHINVELKKIQDSTKQTDIGHFCLNIIQFLNARKQLMEFYENVLSFGTTNSSKYLKCTVDLLSQIESITSRNIHSFTGIIMTPVKAIFNVECEILKSLLTALKDMSQLLFVASLASIYGAHTRLSIWEQKLENREVALNSWKLGFLKNTQLPLLFQWHLRFKAAVLSKFSFYFYDTLCKQTTSSEMNKSCVKLQYDYYNKMATFQKKYDVSSIMLIADSAPPCAGDDYFPVIVSHPPKQTLKMDENRVRMILDLAHEIKIPDKICYNHHVTTQQTHIITLVEPNTYLYLNFDSKKSDKDVYINNFILEFCANLRCSKVFESIKYQSK